VVKIKIFSDQFNNWSDYYERKVNCISSSKAKDTFRKTAKSAFCSPWIFDKALQALWQVWLQMRIWARPRPQILFISEQTGATASDGLYPPGLLGKGKRASGKLSKGKSYPRRALRYQPGTFKAQGEVLARAPPGLRGRNDGNISDRCGRDSHSLY
jgi:hypothetical protein